VRIKDKFAKFEVTPEEPMWKILEAGVTPWGGHWYAVEILGLEKWPVADTFIYEGPSFMYIELDAEAGRTHSKLLTYSQHQQHPNPAFVPAETFLYEATTNVRAASRERGARAAVALAVDDLISKWKKAPLFSGDQQTFSVELTHLPTMEFIENVFGIDRGFQGLGDRTA
jgi:hypothetical protein